MARLTGPRAVAWAAGAALALAACAAPGPVAVERFYSLAPVPAITPAAAPLPATLRVEPLAARGFVGGREIVFRTREEPLQVGRHRHHLWEQPPAAALGEALAQALREARLFQLVVTRDGGARADYRLGGRVIRFEHRPTDQPQGVAVAFELLLVADRDRRGLHAARYQGEEAMTADDPTEMVAAFERLSARLIGEAVRDLQAQRPQLVAGILP